MSGKYACFSRYLASKKSVDDRALNQHVWQTLRQNLPQKRLRILEIGAGIGTMIERVLDWGLCESADYYAIDSESTNLTVLQHRLTKKGSFQLVGDGAAPVRLMRFDDFLVSAETIDLFDFIQREQGKQQWDLIIAHAFLDLVDIPTALPQLFSLLAPEGHFYFTINFDGITALEPAIDPDFDNHIEAIYHQTMDQRLINGKPSGDSKAGRHLIQHIREAGGDVLAAGSSDWVVLADVNGQYHEDEAYFLHFIIATMHGALRENPAINLELFEQTIEQRHEQINTGELVYIAHQIDLVGRLPASSIALS